MKTLLGFALATFCVAMPALSSTYVLNAAGTGDFPDIQTAFLSVADGDSILLQDGRYTGPGNRGVSTNGRNVLLASISGNAEECVIDAEGLSWGFSINSGETSDLILRGFAIENAYTDGVGAGICIAGSSPRIEDCRIQKCIARFVGGGMHCSSGSPSILRCRFVQNESIEATGGAVRLDISDSTFEDCVFVGNSAVDGGGVYCYGDVCHFLRCTFIDNQATGGVGGAIGEIGTDLLIEQCRFERNHADDWGGAIASRNCLVQGCAFLWNSASIVGGAVACGSNYSEFLECLFLGNTAQWSGAINVKAGTAIIHQSTFVGNSATEEAAGIYVYDNSEVTLTSSIIAFSPDGESVRLSEDSSLDISCCDFYENADADWGFEIADQYGINGNISENPLFCDVTADSLKLHEGSPCAPFSPPNPECGLIGALSVGCHFQGIEDILVDATSALGLRVVSPTRGGITFALTNDTSEPALATVAVYDLSGRKIGTAYEGQAAPGTQKHSWSPVAGGEDPLPNGVYILRLNLDGRPTASGRAIVLK